MRLVGAGVYDVSEYHAIWVPGSAARALAALREVTAAEVPLVRLLTGIRALPGRLAGKHRRPLPRDEPLFDQLLSGGFVVLAEDPGAEVVLGTIGQFWDLAGGISPKIDDATGFRDFDDPGFAKAAINFRFQAQGRRTRVETATRVLATDRESRRKLLRYWRVIRPGSGLIRRSILRAVRRRVKHSG